MCHNRHENEIFSYYRRAMAGRPTKYTEELIDKICERIATSSDGLHKICEDDGMPHAKTVFRWLTESDKTEFRDKYARAREIQADLLADEIIRIADESRIGRKTRETKDGTFTETGDMVERSRLMIDARKWKASKLAPKKYGDKLDLTTGGEQISANITHNIIIENPNNGNADKAD